VWEREVYKQKEKGTYMGLKWTREKERPHDFPSSFSKL
jgi:hypothetical protein